MRSYSVTGFVLVKSETLVGEPTAGVQQQQQRAASKQFVAKWPGKRRNGGWHHPTTCITLPSQCALRFFCSKKKSGSGSREITEWADSLLTLGSLAQLEFLFWKFWQKAAEAAASTQTNAWTEPFFGVKKLDGPFASL